MCVPFFLKVFNILFQEKKKNDYPILEDSAKKNLIFHLFDYGRVNEFDSMKLHQAIWLFLARVMIVFPLLCSIPHGLGAPLSGYIRLMGPVRRVHGHGESRPSVAFDWLELLAKFRLRLCVVSNRIHEFHIKCMSSRDI